MKFFSLTFGFAGTRCSRELLPALLPTMLPATVLTLLTLLSGCTVGPDYHRPELPVASGYTAASDATNAATDAVAPQHFVMGRDIPFAWWQQFHSPKLDALVERALKANPDITAAEAALHQAQEYVIAQQGFFYPTVNASFTPTRNKLAGNQSSNAPGLQGNGTNISGNQNPNGPPYNAPVYYNFYTAQLSLGYTPDVFGANRRAVESLQASADMARYQMEATYISLSSNVVGAVIQLAALKDQIRATQAFIDDNARADAILHQQLSLGYVMGIDVANQDLALAQARQLLPPLMKQTRQTRDLVNALCGELPDRSLDIDISLADLTLPADLPLSLPSAIIEQRPDVRAAEEQLHAASAQVGVAIAARLPQFSISAALGGAASEIPQMFKSGAPFWTIGGSLSQTLLDGGTLLHHQRAAEQALVGAQAQYRSAVISAFQNVADTLHAIQSDNDALNAATDAQRAAQVALALTDQQYRAGYVNYQTLLAAREAYQQLAINMAQARANSLGDSVALFQALGGGWWHRNDDVTGTNPDLNTNKTTAANP